MPPAVSVLVPSYNKAAYLDATLQSVYEQTLRDFELIVVDDGSSDGSVERLRAHHGRAQVIYQSNRGVSAARTRALEQASGRFIQYLDADDLLLPDALRTRVEALERTGADVAYGDWQRFYTSASGERTLGAIEAREMNEVSPDPELACFTRFWAPPVALLYSAALARKLRWNAALPVIQDARYLLDAALAGARFTRVPGVHALYRDDDPGSLSRRNRHAFAADVIRNADQVAAIWRAQGALSPERATALAGSYDYAARAVFRRDPALASQCALRLTELQQLRPLGWPRLAQGLQRALGHGAALRVLSWLGRPAD